MWVAVREDGFRDDSPTGCVEGTMLRRTVPIPYRGALAMSIAKEVPQPPEPPVSANTSASSDASPVTSPITAVRPRTGRRLAPNATAFTGCHGEPGSPLCSHTAMPRSVRKGSGPGRCQATTIASPSDVCAYHVPATSSPFGTRSSTGTSPAGRSEG